MDELLEFPWMKNFQSQNTLSEAAQLNISANLASFRKTSTFQSGVCSIIANLQIKSEELRDVRQMFIQLDTNADGFLSLEELEAGLQDVAAIFNLEEPDVRDMLRAADTNGDGKVDYTEFIVAALQKDLLLKRDHLRGAFNMLDLDGDGMVTKDELKQVFGYDKHSEEVWDEIMAEVDKN